MGLVLPPDSTLEEAERRLIVSQVRRHPTRAQAAKALGIGVRTLFTKLRGYGLDIDSEDESPRR
jgi:DNA-binding NtrC family response regulator